MDAAAQGGRLSIGSAVARALASDEIHRVLDQVVEHRQPVAHAAGAAGQVDDQRAAADAGRAARERGARKPRVDRHPERLGDAGGLLVEHGAGGFGGDVARGEAGAAGGEDEIGEVGVGPGGEGGGDPDGLVGDEGAVGEDEAVRRGPGGDGVARGVGPLAAVAGVGDGEDGDAQGSGRRDGGR